MISDKGEDVSALTGKGGVWGVGGEGQGGAFRDRRTCSVQWGGDKKKHLFYFLQVLQLTVGVSEEEAEELK